MPIDRRSHDAKPSPPSRRTPARRRRSRLREAVPAAAVLCALTLSACGSGEPEQREAASPTPPAVDAPIRNPTPQQAERLRVALATNIDPALARRYERVAPLATRGCRLMRRDPTAATWDATILGDLHDAGFDDLTLRDASLFLEILRSDLCPITG